MGLVRRHIWQRTKITRGEADHTKIYKEVEHARATRPERGTNQSVKWAKGGKKCSNSAKQEICLSLGEKFPRKPGKTNQVDLFINKTQKKLRCH